MAVVTLGFAKIDAQLASLRRRLIVGRLVDSLCLNASLAAAWTSILLCLALDERSVEFRYAFWTALVVSACAAVMTGARLYRNRLSVNAAAYFADRQAKLEDRLTTLVAHRNSPTKRMQEVLLAQLLTVSESWQARALAPLRVPRSSCVLLATLSLVVLAAAAHRQANAANPVPPGSTQPQIPLSGRDASVAEPEAGSSERARVPPGSPAKNNKVLRHRHAGTVRTTALAHAESGAGPDERLSERSAGPETNSLATRTAPRNESDATSGEKHDAPSTRQRAASSPDDVPHTAAGEPRPAGKRTSTGAASALAAKAEEQIRRILRAETGSQQHRVSAMRTSSPSGKDLVTDESTLSREGNGTPRTTSHADPENGGPGGSRAGTSGHAGTNPLGAPAAVVGETGHTRGARAFALRLSGDLQAGRASSQSSAEETSGAAFSSTVVLPDASASNLRPQSSEESTFFRSVVPPEYEATVRSIFSRKEEP